MRELQILSKEVDQIQTSGRAMGSLMMWGGGEMKWCFGKIFQVRVRRDCSGENCSGEIVAEICSNPTVMIIRLVITEVKLKMILKIL